MTLKQQQEGKLHGDETAMHLSYSINTQTHMRQDSGAVYPHSAKVSSEPDAHELRALHYLCNFLQIHNYLI